MQESNSIDPHCDIYIYSRGIPRVINIACDRSLLTAFSLSRHRITGSIARASIKELMGAGATGKFNLADWKKGFIIFAVLSVVMAAAIFHQPLTYRIIEFFKQQQNPEIEGPGIGEPASKDAEIFEADNFLVSDPNIS